MAQANDKVFVTFADGARVGFTPKKLVVKLVDSAKRAVKFYFRNERLVVIGRDDVSADTWDRLALHGLSQKCGDEGSREDVTTADEFYQAVDAMRMRLADGTAFTREAGERIPDRDLFDAMAALGYLDPSSEDAVGEYRKLTTEQRSALRMLEDIAAELARVAKERAKDVDTAGLLGKFKTGASYWVVPSQEKAAEEE
jgi:hypothetical protein